MEESIRKILWNFVAGEVTDSEAVQQVLDLLAVSEKEQLEAFVEKWNTANEIADSPVIHDSFIDDFLKSHNAKPYC